MCAQVSGLQLIQITSTHARTGEAAIGPVKFAGMVSPPEGWRR